MCGSQRSHGVDAVIATIAGGQHGVVSRAQLLAAGVTERQIDWRLKRRRLHRVHRSVYAVGHAVLSQEAVWMAAVLAGGEGAVLSHWSAASLLRMRPGRGPRSHVTCVRKRRRLDAITFHCARLRPDEVAKHNGIPTTTPARTQLDLAALLPSAVLGRMITAAGPGTGPSLSELIDRYPRKPGVPKLRAIVRDAQPFTRSDLEANWLERIQRAGLPRPAANQVVEGYEVDLVWWEHGVIAEVDSYVTHGSHYAFERDRERDRKLAAAGWVVVRVTDAQTDAALADLTQLLASSAARSPRRRAWAA
jgi:very-short-patch-repair endonuclease